MEKALNQLAHDAITLAFVLRVQAAEGCNLKTACEIAGEQTGRSMATVRRSCRRARKYLGADEVAVYVDAALI